MAPLAEMAKILRLSEETLNAWVAEGRIRAYRDRGDVYLKAAEVRRFVEEGDGQDPGSAVGKEDRPPVASATEGAPPAPAGEDTIPLPDLARFLDISEEELDGILRGGILRAVRDDEGKAAILRSELARLLLATAGRASLLEAAGVEWPESGEPAPVLGETRGDELEEDATEETSIRTETPVVAPPRGAVTVRYFSRMNSRRSYPLLLQGARLSGPVRAVPRVPGCLCVPAGLDLTPEHARGEFWITPQTLGPVPTAAVEFFVSGERTAEIRVPFNVGTLAGAWILLGLSGAFLLLTPFLELLGSGLEGEGTLAFMLGMLGGPVGFGLLLSVLAFTGGAVWFFRANPAESRPLTVSLTATPEDREGIP
jgi:excisionase family DNA binding protein